VGLRLPARLSLLALAGLCSACTVIHVAGADRVETRVLPGIAVVTLEAGPGAVLVVKRVGYGLSVNQGQLLVGYESSDQVFAGPGVDCLAVLLPAAGLDADQMNRERERISNACKKTSVAGP
jgi:hypothetical protein